MVTKSFAKTIKGLKLLSNGSDGPHWMIRFSDDAVAVTAVGSKVNDEIGDHLIGRYVYLTTTTNGGRVIRISDDRPEDEYFDLDEYGGIIRNQ
jgi:hypothetical protein